MGGYVIPLLLPGRYTVTASIAGFRSHSLDGLEIGLGAHVRAEFELDVGSRTETVEVVADQPLLQRDDATISTVITQEQLVSYPSGYRNYLSLLKLASNVATDMDTSGMKREREGGERSHQGTAVAGQRQEFNRFTLDGIENTDVNFNSYIIRPSIDALSEVKVETGIYSAQYGRATSQIIAGTKSGTNDFHGTLFAFKPCDRLNAGGWRGRGERPTGCGPTKIFGFTLGGPIVKNRVFFFSNAELVREVHTSSNSISVVPSSDMRAGDFSRQQFSQNPQVIFDPLTRVFDGNGTAVSAEPFPNQVIPQSRLHPVALALLEFYPLPNGHGIPNYFGDGTYPRNSEQYLQRFDFQESSSSSWFGRFSHGNERFGRANGAFPTQTGRTEARSYQWLASNTRSFSPRALNEFRVGYNRFNNDDVTHFAFKRDVVSELGIRGLTTPVNDRSDR